MAELTDWGDRQARRSAMLVACGVAAALGLIPLMAFFVLGLGDLLQGNYVLSSLIVALFFLAVGGGTAYAIARRMRHQELLPRTRHLVDQQVDSLTANAPSFMKGKAA